MSKYLFRASEEDSHPELQRLEGVPFYIWNESEENKLKRHSKGQYTFNELIGLPQRDGEEMILMPYQHELYELLKTHRFCWIKKSRGVGMSEFFLRLILYNCFNKYPPHSQICICVGPSQRLAEDLLTRFKNLIQNKLSPNFFDRSRSTEATINTVRVIAIPSFHSSVLRSRDMVKFIYIDESAYIPEFQQREIGQLPKDS
jgi:hypothetical protein